MGYVIAGIIVLLIVAGFITYLVMNSMRKGSSVAADDGQPGIGGDETPLGDTTQHAGEQTPGGETAQDAERNAGVDPAAGPARPEDRQLGDAGASTTAPQAPQPESERLADRPR